MASGESMDRGSQAMFGHLDENLKQLQMRQTRRGWLMECCCPCQARTEFKYFKDNEQGKKQEFAHSLADANMCCRCACSMCYPYTVVVEELNTQAEILTVDRPFKCCGGACKCCCYQQVHVKSGGEDLGTTKEACYYCVPQYNVMDHNGTELYKIHPPTCWGGCCVNCFTEGNPCCGRGCCKVPFWIFPAGENTAEGEESNRMVGKILKKPKSLMTEIFTDAVAIDIDFPQNATSIQKALLTASALLINTIHFENTADDDD